MRQFNFQARDLDDTLKLGAALAEILLPGSVIALSGTLGAGKTRLVQAVAAAAGFDPRDVTSPTFVLVNEYAARVPIYHFDAYRVRDDDEFLQLGPEEYFERPAWCFIEWAERVESGLPLERLEIAISVLGDTARRFEFIARGARYEQALSALKEILTSKSKGRARTRARKPAKGRRKK
jgi:tRNA threonylcarbamoyladenosine biosynthesis protein TsaE